MLTGNGAMFLNDAIERSEELEYFCVRNEAVAPMAAAADSQLTGVPGVICVTAGPGSTNALSGVAEAWVDSASILVLSGQVPSGELHNYGRTMVRNRSFGIAGVPITDYATGFTKLAISLSSPSELKESLCEILLSLKHGRKGPVWLDIPLDIQAAEIADFSLSEIQQEVDRKLGSLPPNPLDLNDVEAIRILLSKSRRPLIVLGRGIESINNKSEFLELLSTFPFPFAPSRVVAYLLPLSMNANLGVLGVRGRPWSKEILKSADLIVSFGCRLPTSITGPNYSYLNPDSRLVVVDIDAEEIARHGSRLTLGLEKSVSQLSEILAPLSEGASSSHRQWLTECRRKKLSDITNFMSQKEDDVFNIYWFMKTLERYAPPKTILITDAGSNYYASGQAVDFDIYQMEITSGTFAAMGLSLPLALGASIESKTNGGMVFCVTGDGSIELNVQELQTLLIYDLPVKVFIINNGGYASMRTWQETYFEGRYIGSTDDTGAKPLDFKKLAFAFNLDYEQIISPKDMKSKMEKIVKSRNPQVIEVFCDSKQKLLLPMQEDLI